MTVIWESEFTAPTFAPEWYAGSEHDFGDKGLWPTVTPVKSGQPSPVAGEKRKVARFEVSPEDASAGRIHAKVYKTPGASWAEAAGSYQARLYVPRSIGVKAWAHLTNVFQFKEGHGSAGASEVLAFVRLIAGYAGGSEPPVLALYSGAPGTTFEAQWRDALVCPLDRWFTLRADVDVERGVTPFYADGKFIGVSHDLVSHYGDTKNLTFGLGNYGTAQGPLYFDRASLTR